LKPYCWSGTAYVFSPNPNQYLDFKDATGLYLPPRTITKDIKKEWVIAHRATNLLRKTEYKNREYMSFSLSGSCDEYLRERIEFYSKKDAKFLIIPSWTDTEAYSAPDIFKSPRTDTHTDPFSATYDNIFVAFIGTVRFEQIEGKIGWFNYKIDLERVYCEGITGCTNAWTCAGTYT
jgi:hypothetical protein